MLSHENVTERTVHAGYYFAKVHIKDSNPTIDQTIKNYTTINDSSRKKSTGRGDDYTIGCLLNFMHFKED